MKPYEAIQCNGPLCQLTFSLCAESGIKQSRIAPINTHKKAQAQTWAFYR